MPDNQGRPGGVEGVIASGARGWLALQGKPAARGGFAPPEILPHVVTTVHGSDKLRTHFTFTNIGLTPVYSVTVETVRHDGQTMDFETIDELRPGVPLTCLAIVYPVIHNDPHWTFEFWSNSGDESLAPFVVRYQDEYGRPITMRNTLRWSGRRMSVVPDNAPVAD